MKKEVKDNDTQPKKDRKFDGFLYAKTQAAALVVFFARHIVEKYEDYKGLRKRARNKRDQAHFEHQVEALVSDLIWGEIETPGQWTSISLSKGYLGSKDRYRAPVMTKRLPIILKILATQELEYVERREATYSPFAPHLNRQTVIRAGSALREMIGQHGLTLMHFGRNEAEEVIILKDSKEDHWDKGKWLQYEDTEETIQHRKDLKRINRWLDQASIRYVPYGDEQQASDVYPRRLRRYFNNGSFHEGGRLFGGRWMEMKREDRTWIQVDDEWAVTLDYGQMAPRILYGMVGVDPAFEDAYTLPGLEQWRDGVKKVFNAMLHSDRPLLRCPMDTRKLLPRDQSIHNLQEAIRSFHGPIAHALNQKQGMLVTYWESQILIRVLLRLIDGGITALPIHDAVMVHYDHADRAKQVMLEVFQEETGIEGRVSIEE